MNQSDHIQEHVQQAARGNREAFTELILAGGPDLRLMLAAHVESFSAIARLELGVWVTAAGCLGDYDATHSFGDWLFALAVAPLTEHLQTVAARALVVQDVITHFLAQNSLTALSDGSELKVLTLAAVCEALPENTRALLTARYRDRHTVHLIASRQGGDEPALANALVAARARCDWRGLAKPPVASDRDLPPAIEDVLSGIIDNASRVLMADYLARGQQQVQQIARQVRVNVALRTMFMPFTRTQATALARQALARQASAGRMMAGQVVLNTPVHVPVVPRVVIISEKSPAPRAVPLEKAGTGSSRPASVSVRIDEDDQENWPVAKKKKPQRRAMWVPYVIVGVLVLGGVMGLMVTNRSKAPSPPVVADKWTAPVAPLPEPEKKPNAVLPAPTPVETGALRPLPPPVPEKPSGGPLQVKLVGVVADNHQYAGRELVLRSVLSSNDGIARVEYWNGDTKLGESATAPWTFTWTPAAGALSLTARAIPQTGETTTSPVITLTAMTAYGSGSLRREWWTGIPGDQLKDLDKVAGYPTRPQGHGLVEQFASPNDWNDNYLQRLWGFLIPPLDGEYVFWIAADDEAQLWLSSDDTAATRQLIATSRRSRHGVGRMEWTRQPNQQSAPIRLQAGRRYLIEAVHKEGGGGDHVAVGWRLPNESLERPIPGIHLSPPIVEPTPDVPVPPPATAPVTPPPVTTWTVVRAINLGGETVDIDGVHWLGHRQAEEEGETPANSHQPGPWLSDLPWTRVTNGNNQVRRDRSTTDRPLTIEGKVYAKGLGVHAPSEVVYALDGQWAGFTALVGVDDVADGAKAEVIFQVWLDGQKAWDSGRMRKGSVKPVAVPLAGRKELRLVVDTSGPNDWDQANWANAQFTRPGGNDGSLQIKTGKRSAASYTPKPAVDAKMRALLTTALSGTSKEGLEFSVRVPNGPLRVWLLLGESGSTNSRQFELDVDGTTMPPMNGMPTGSWQKLGPVDLFVTDELVTVKATPTKGTPQLMGFLAERPDLQLTAPLLSGTDPLAIIPDAVGFTQIYQADLKKLAKEVPYEVDNTAKFSGAFKRIAYLMELQEADKPLRWVWTSMDAFTADVRQIGVPTLSSGVFFQQTVANLLVASNVDGVPVGVVGDGVIEFWSSSYNPNNQAGIPGATDAYDFGDKPVGKGGDGYGSMQVHNLGAKQTVWALNHWIFGNKADLGIGPSPTNGDWTFAGNGEAFVFKRLRVFVKPAP